MLRRAATKAYLEWFLRGALEDDGPFNICYCARSLLVFTSNDQSTFFFLTFYYLFSFFHIFKQMPLLVKSSIATLEKPLASRLVILV